MRYYFFFILCFFIYTASAQNNPPLLKCVSVQVNGNIMLSWNAPNPSTGLFDYTIYRSSNGGVSYTPIPNVNAALTNYIDPVGNANTQQYYYYMEARYNGGAQTSVSSDILQSMMLTVPAPVTGNLSVAMLSWNSLHQPTLPQHSNGKYHIYKQFHGKTFFVDSTLLTNYSDTNRALCDKPDGPVIYNILFIVNHGTYKDTCSSSYSMQRFHDDLPPSTPVVIRVTVDTITGKTMICWHPVHARDLKGYTTVKDPSGAQTPTKDSVSTPDTCLIIKNANPNSTAETYSIFAYDSCGNNGLYNTLGHTTIFLQSRLDFCAGKIFISWTPYKGWSTGVESYLLYVSENGSPFHRLDSLGAGVFNYTHTGLMPFFQYRYYIKAKQNNRPIVSISNIPPVQIFRSAQAPTYMNISSINALSQAGNIVVTFETDPNGQPKQFKLLRSDDNKTFKDITTISAVSNQGNYTFNDNSTTPSSNTYYYKVVAIDSCDQTLQLSDTVSNILLNVKHNDDYENTLNWSPYMGWHGNISQYNIYESQNTPGNPQLLSSVSNGTVTFDRNVSGYTDANGRFCYYIEAIENGGNGNKSYSNQVCDIQAPRLFVPNAFIPDSQIPANQTFKPVSDFVDVNQYKMVIYNRWAEKIFETNTPNVGWDGNFKGKRCEGSVYIYHIQFTATDGTYFEKKGTIALIR